MATETRYLWSIHSRVLPHAVWTGSHWSYYPDPDNADLNRAYYETLAGASIALELADKENMDAYMTREL